MTTRSLDQSLQAIHLRIRSACAHVQRDGASVQLLAVSKTFSAALVAEAIAAGQTAFGENYIQEGVEKIRAIADLLSTMPLKAGVQQTIQWHCIGPIQSNKTRLVASHFDWVHTVDRLKIAERLSEQRPPELAPLNICIQVNIDGGLNKAGVAPQAALELAHAIARLPRLRLRGLMSIPEPAVDFETAVAVHTQAHTLYQNLKQQGFNLDTLSMGMSADLEAAIQAGSTMVRVGSAIFGGREVKNRQPE